MRFQDVRFAMAFVCTVMAGIYSSAGDAPVAGPAFKNGQTVAFVGDSITRDGLATIGGYGSLVIRSLEANGIAVKPIKAGNGGECSIHMLARIDSIIAQKPDWVSLSCGVNDVGFSPQKANVSLEDYKKATSSLVDKIQAAGISVLLLTPTPVGEDPQNDQNKRMAPYVEHIRALAAEKHCLLADLNAAMHAAIAGEAKGRTARLPGEAGVFLRDGIHMNQLGDLVMARGILLAIGMTPELLKTAEAKLIAADAPPSSSVAFQRFIPLNQYLLLDEAAKIGRRLSPGHA